MMGTITETPSVYHIMIHELSHDVLSFLHLFVSHDAAVPLATVTVGPVLAVTVVVLVENDP